MIELPVTETSAGINFSVRVHPGARKNAITGVHADALKISLSTPPVDGRANEALVAFLAETLHVPRASITIVSGQHNRSKRVRITGMAKEELHIMLAPQLL